MAACPPPWPLTNVCAHVLMRLCAWAAGVVDVCLIPEVPFSLEKLCEYVGQVLEKKGNAVVCVAEGAGQVRLDGAAACAACAPT